MLFNSYIFIFLFLPVVVLLFHVLRHNGHMRSAIFVLVLASFLFYAWWSYKYLFLLTGLMLFDCLIATQIEKHRQKRKNIAKGFLTLGLVINLGALGYYKYANFFVDNINALFGIDLFLASIVLPIGISFFTFQKVAFLIDMYQGKTEKFNALNYALFITFFPQLIAGPIVHHSEVIPQFENLGRAMPRTIIIGITIFIIGLSKKVLLADTVAHYASPHFDAAAAGIHLNALTAWSAALAYTAQIYFDFSAYSDMAIGIGLLFGIKLPVNFDSPYKSRNIVEFWRRWHITLSRFLRDYLYIPLGGNRKGKMRRYANLMITMVLGGIWHGAGWTFLIWGALHGFYLMVSHFWSNFDISWNGKAFALLSRVVTFLAVVTAWIFFRAANVETAVDILYSMTGKYGLQSVTLDMLAVPVGLLIFSFLMPNTQQIMNYEPPAGTYGAHASKQIPLCLRWKATWPWALYIGLLFSACLMFMTQVSEFIYFQF